MVRLRLAFQHRRPLVLLLLALVASTSFFLGAIWHAYQSTDPNVSVVATASAFANDTVYHASFARISTVTQSGKTLLCTQVGADDGCAAVDDSRPITMTAAADGGTQVTIVDPQRRISHVTFDFGDELLDLDSDNGGLSVSASLSRAPNSVTAYDRDGNIISTQSRK